MVHHQLFIQVNGNQIPGHDDAKAVPLAEGLVGKHEGIFPWPVPRIIPEPSRALVGTNIPLPTLFGVVPDLNLRNPPEIDPTIRLRHRSVFEQQLEISEISLRT